MQESISAQPQQATAARQASLIEWSTAYGVGVEIIDDQHQGLVDVLNAIHKGINDGWNKEQTTTALLKLVDDTLVHFATEESMMQVHHYPKDDAHENRHANLIQRMEQHIQQYNQDPDISKAEVFAFFERWLLEHILKDDKPLGEFLVRHGVT